jgi:hypothetical protein
LDPERVLAELSLALSGLGVEVRSRALRGTRPSTGGLCRIGGQNVVILNSQATALERGTVLANALFQLGFERLETLTPESRTLVQRRGRHAPETPKTPAKGPGIAGLGAHGRRRP